MDSSSGRRRYAEQVGRELLIEARQDDIQRLHGYLRDDEDAIRDPVQYLSGHVLMQPASLFQDAAKCWFVLTREVLGEYDDVRPEGNRCPGSLQAEAHFADTVVEVPGGKSKR
jgi:hypothetical protein